MAELIAYFSRKHQNYVNGMLKNLEVGNTEIAAGIIQRLTGADLFKLEPVQEYSRDYNECIAEAQVDQRRDARPELKHYPEEFEKYDTIYLGFPNYWSTMPMAVFTFLEHFDFTGKTICPFCTHEGSGMGSSDPPPLSRRKAEKRSGDPRRKRRICGTGDTQVAEMTEGS